MQSTNAIRAFCSQLSGPTAFTGTGWGSRAGASVRVLSNLFYGLEQHWSSRSQYYVYDALVDVCQRASLIHELPTDLVQLNVRVMYTLIWGRWFMCRLGWTHGK